MRFLVTGAAGYIGSIVTEQLIQQGHAVLALDSLKHGHRSAVHRGARFVQGDLFNRDWLIALLAQNPVDAVVHLAAEALIDVSMRDPGLFFRTNVCGGINLLDAMVANDIKRIVFSSTAAVYGESDHMPICEDTQHLPVNSYGESKLAFEKILHWYHIAHGLNYVTLRYFNACGATECFGELHIPETHIIPILFEVALGLRKSIRLFGTDYDTIDGTCIRDYIHVSDIAQAHILALKNIDQLGARAYNLGNGNGYTNTQVIDATHYITGRDISVIPSDRRPGDPARLIASSEKIRAELGWTPQYPELEIMIETAWAWRSKNPCGYVD